MSSKIAKKFNELNKKNKKALITYITLGDPSLNKTVELVNTLEGAGADIIELGIPYSDPLADGPVIQRAAQRALKRGIDMGNIFETVEKIRENTDIPLVFLLYYNTMFSHGIERFLDKCMNYGIDGLVIPDVPLEEREIIYKMAQQYKVDLIPLVAPTSNNRVKKIVESGQGFVYCISSRGVTGARKEFDQGLNDFVEEVKRYSKLPITIGFGISGKESIKRLKSLANGLIIGSAIIEEIEKGLEDGDICQRVYKFTKELRETLD